MALAAQDRPVVLLVGGRSKGFTYEVLAQACQKNVRSAICYGEAAEKLSEAFAEVPHDRATTLAEAVQKAARSAKSGDVILLSPGHSSFDQFTDFEQRGEAFRLLVASQVGG